MNPPPDYYEILSLPRSATQDDIKKSFRSLAIKHHPDKNPSPHKQIATEKFKQISEAYETLSDPQKKSNYDMFGKRQQYQTVNSSSAEDVFRMFWKNFKFEEEECFGDYGGKKGGQKYYSDTPMFVGRDYRDVFRGYYGSGGSGVKTTGVYGGAGWMFGGMTSVGGRNQGASNDIPAGNMWSPSYNSTTGGYSDPTTSSYYDYSSQPQYQYQYPTPSQPSNYQPKYSHPSTSTASISKEVEKVTSEVNGKKVVTTKTKVFNKDGTQTITEVIETEGEKKAQKVYKIQG